MLRICYLSVLCFCTLIPTCLPLRLLREKAVLLYPRSSLAKQKTTQLRADVWAFVFFPFHIVVVEIGKSELDRTDGITYRTDRTVARMDIVGKSELDRTVARIWKLTPTAIL